MHVDKTLQEMINRPARSCAGTSINQTQACNQSHVTVSVENKGSGESTSSAMSASQEQSSGASKNSSSDKREREPPDATVKPKGKSLKTSGMPTSSQNTASG